MRKSSDCLFRRRPEYEISRIVAAVDEQSNDLDKAFDQQSCFTPDLRLSRLAGDSAKSPEILPFRVEQRAVDPSVSGVLRTGTDHSMKSKEDRRGAL
jgi:hypothetical protein